VYDRSKEGEGFLGMLDIKPVLKDGYVHDSWYKLGTRGQEHVTGELWLQTTYHVIRVSDISGPVAVKATSHCRAKAMILLADLAGTRRTSARARAILIVRARST
jgi:hypothetical protein